MAGLRVEQGGRAENEAGVFENAAANGDVSLRLRHVARLEIDPRLEAQPAGRRLVSADGAQVGRAAPVDHEFRQILVGAEGGEGDKKAGHGRNEDWRGFAHGRRRKTTRTGMTNVK